MYTRKLEVICQSLKLIIINQSVGWLCKYRAALAAKKGRQRIFWLKLPVFRTTTRGEIERKLATMSIMVTTSQGIVVDPFPLAAVSSTYVTTLSVRNV